MIMAFPSNKTNAVDGVTDIVAAHLNNLENKVGIDGSADATSLDYLVKSAEDPGHTHTSSSVEAATWTTITSKPEITIGDSGYTSLDTVLAAVPAPGTTIIIPPGLTLSARTIGANATLPAGVTLKIPKGSPIQINAGCRLTINGYIPDCIHQIFDDKNTYNYATRTITSYDSGTNVFTLTSHGFVNGDQVFFASYDGGNETHGHYFIGSKTTHTFKLLGPDNTTEIVVGAYVNTDTVALKEAFGVKFINSNTPFVRPEWWGAGIGATAAANNTAFNHAIHNSYYVLAGTNVTDLKPVLLGPGSYPIDGRLYMISGTVFKGVGDGLSGPFMYKTTINVSDSTPAVDSFIYVYDMGEVTLQDFALQAANSITCTKGIEINGGLWKSNNTRIDRVAVTNFSGWGIYCAPGTSYLTKMKHIQIGAPAAGGNGILIQTDSEINHSNLVGGQAGIGLQSAGAQIRDCIIETWDTGLYITDVSTVLGCVFKQISKSGGVGRCIHIADAAYAQQTICNNVLSTAYTGIYCAGQLQDCIIQGNSFSYMGWGAAGYAIDCVGFAGSEITGNRFSNCTYGVFNTASWVNAGALPGNVHDNIGVDVGIACLPTMPIPSSQTWHPQAFGANKFVTNAQSAASVQHFYRSVEEGRRFSVTLGETNTTIAQWGPSVTGQSQGLFVYKVTGGWDATNHYHQLTTFTAFGSPAEVNDAVYIGEGSGTYLEALRLLGVKLFIGTASAGNTVVAEYWDGFAWVTLPSTGPDIFAATGWQSVNWMPPPDVTYSWTEGISVNATTKKFTLTNTAHSWLNPSILTQKGCVQVGDYIITSGFGETGNNGKWLVTAVTKADITVSDAGDALVTESTGTRTLKRAGWAYVNLNAITGLPATPPDFSARWMRLRVTVAAGGQVVVGDGAKYAQFNYTFLKNGDFGPATAMEVGDATIWFKCVNGGLVEERRTDPLFLGGA